jgi:hypothetical protein
MVIRGAAQGSSWRFRAASFAKNGGRTPSLRSEQQRREVLEGRKKGFKPGFTIGSVPDAKVKAFIPVPSEQIGAPEGITANSQGIIYGGYGDNRNLRRFVKK